MPLYIMVLEEDWSLVLPFYITALEGGELGLPLYIMAVKGVLGFTIVYHGFRGVLGLDLIQYGFKRGGGGGPDLAVV